MNKTKLYIFLIAMSLTGYAWLAWNIVEYSAHSSAPTVCMFKEVTGLPCPSCGTTRALLLLINGNIRESLLTNPFGLLLALALVIIPFWIVTDILRKRESFYRKYVWIERFLTQNRWAAVSAVAVVALNWFWNITKGL